MKPKLNDRSVYASGKFPGLQKDEVGACLVAQGARCCESKPAADARQRGPHHPRRGRARLPRARRAAALYADPKDEQLKVIYAHDCWADLTSDHPISLRTYMESLIAGIRGAGWNVGQRLIRPVRKAAWPTYIRNIKGSPYLFLELK